MTAAALFAVAPAYADTVLDTSLANINGPAGAGTATTVTSATGTVTTVTGPGGGANRADAPLSTDTWAQHNVGGNASIGITTQYARSGNGSLSFSGTDGNSKADLEYYFSTPVSLSSFQGASYDWYRDSSSTNPANQVPSLRMLIGNSAGSYLGYLIFEPVYNGVTTAPTDSWQTSTITTASTFWSNNGSLNLPAGDLACPDCYSSLSDWIAANSSATIIGLSTGIGSGWNGSFSGAVDNISFTLGGTTLASNFEVAAGAVPEPATWAMMIAGFGLVGGMMRRRRNPETATA